MEGRFRKHLEEYSPLDTCQRCRGHVIDCHQPCVRHTADLVTCHVSQMGDSARVQTQARAGGSGVHQGEHGADVSDSVTIRLWLSVQKEAGDCVQWV